MELQPPVGVLVQFTSTGQTGLADFTGLAQGLSAEILRLDVDAVEPGVGAGTPQVRELLITMTPEMVEPLLGLLKSWCGRHGGVGVCLKLKVGRKVIDLANDPQEVTPEQVSALVIEMQQS